MFFTKYLELRQVSLHQQVAMVARERRVGLYYLNPASG
jgi:hypothetical protein